MHHDLIVVGNHKQLIKLQGKSSYFIVINLFFVVYIIHNIILIFLVPNNQLVVPILDE